MNRIPFKWVSCILIREDEYPYGLKKQAVQGTYRRPTSKAKGKAFKKKLKKLTHSKGYYKGIKLDRAVSKICREYEEKGA